MCSGCLFLALLLRRFLQLLSIYCFPIGSIREGPGVAGGFAAGAREGAGSKTRARPTDKNKSNHIGKGQGEQRGMSTWLFLRKTTVMQEKWVYVVALPSERKEPPAPSCLGAAPRTQISSCIDMCGFNSTRSVWVCFFFAMNLRAVRSQILESTISKEKDKCKQSLEEEQKKTRDLESHLRSVTEVSGTHGMESRTFHAWNN